MTTPAADGTVAQAGQMPPPNPVLKALQDAWAELKKTLTSPATEQMLVNGVFTFLATEFPVAAPFLAPVESLILKLLGAA